MFTAVQPPYLRSLSLAEMYLCACAIRGVPCLWDHGLMMMMACTHPARAGVSVCAPIFAGLLVWV